MKDLLLLHGALGTHSLFEPLNKALEGHFQIHQLSFSGHGMQDFNPNGFGIEVFAREVEAFLNDKGLDKVPVFGYSMGGYVALYLEYLKPGNFSSIVTLGTKFGWNPETSRKEAGHLVPEVIAEKVPRFAQMLAQRHQDWEALVRATAQMMIALGEKPLLNEESLGNIQCPVTILLGDDDNMVTLAESENAASHLPNAQFKLVENCPHPIEKVNPEMLSKTLISMI